jgi:hypothetical protein
VATTSSSSIGTAPTRAATTTERRTHAMLIPAAAPLDEDGAARHHAGASGRRWRAAVEIDNLPRRWLASSLRRATRCILLAKTGARTRS